MQLKQFEPINVEKHEHEIVPVDAHEVESLDIQALDVQELERRLELASAIAYPEGWRIFEPNEQ